MLKIVCAFGKRLVPCHTYLHNDVFLFDSPVTISVPQNFLFWTKHQPNHAFTYPARAHANAPAPPLIVRAYRQSKEEESFESIESLIPLVLEFLFLSIKPPLFLLPSFLSG